MFFTARIDTYIQLLVSGACIFHTQDGGEGVAFYTFFFVTHAFFINFECSLWLFCIKQFYYSCRRFMFENIPQLKYRNPTTLFDCKFDDGSQPFLKIVFGKLRFTFHNCIFQWYRTVWVAFVSQLVWQSVFKRRFLWNIFLYQEFHGGSLRGTESPFLTLSKI